MMKSGASQKIVPSNTNGIIINLRPQKDDPNQVRITIGSNPIDYPYELTTCTANMVSSKFMWNSVISTPGAKFGGTDIKKMYLETQLDWYEYFSTHHLCVGLNGQSHT
jgi:hypothetical protein